MKGLNAAFIGIVAASCCVCGQAEGFSRVQEKDTKSDHPAADSTYQLLVDSVLLSAENVDFQVERIRFVAVSLDESKLAYVDRKDPVPRIVDLRSGKIRALGKAGEGPGEFRSPYAITWLTNGGLAVRDLSLRRVSFFDSTLRHTHQLSGQDSELVGRRGFNAATVNEVFAVGATATPSAIRIVRSDSAGRQTSRMIADGGYRKSCPEVRLNSPGNPILGQAPTITWTVTRNGSLIIGCPATYTFDIHGPEGKIQTISRTVRPISRTDDERSAIRANFTRAMQREMPNWAWSGPDIPREFPAYSKLDIGHDHRIWVTIPMPSIQLRTDSGTMRWRETSAFDVFEPDGRFFATVRKPLEFDSYSEPTFGKRYVWGATRDADGMASIVRFRISRVAVAPTK